MKTTATQRLMFALAAGAALVVGLPGCVPLVVGGAAVAGGMVATDRRSSGAQLDDQAIELRAASRVRDIANDNMNVTVISYNRQVLLVGTVGNEADKRRVEELVARVDNVRGVVNDVTVGPSSTLPERSNDTFITGKVRASMLDSKDIFANSFKVVTEAGVVYIMGIATRQETDRATDVARGVSGVKKVVRVVEVMSESEIAANQRANAAPSPPAPVQDAAPASSSSSPSSPSSSSRVPLPPMAPLPPPGGSAPASGATTSPVTTSPIR